MRGPLAHLAVCSVSVCLLSAIVCAQNPPPGAKPAPAAAPATSPAAAAGPQIVWEQDYDAAMQRAATEKKPVFVAFLMDDEPANDQTIKDHYKDPQIVKLLGQFVCLVGCIGEHRGPEGGCTKFPGIECAHHQAIEKKARERWLLGDLVCTPQHVFCDPKGAVLHRKIYLISKPTLAKMLLLTLEDCGIDTKNLQVDFGKDSEAAMPASEREQVTKWLADLDSRNLELREPALRGLGGAEDSRALPAVLTRCGNKSDDATRVAAIRALARKGNFQALDRLTALLGENDAQILGAVASALETIQLPQAAGPLVTAIKKEKRDRVLGALLRAASKSQPSNADVREVCLKQLKSASKQLEGSLLIALGNLDTHEKIVGALTPMLTSKNLNVRGLTAWALGNQQTKDSEKALQQLDKVEKSPEVTQLLPFALKQVRGETVEGYESKYWSFFSGS